MAATARAFLKQTPTDVWSLREKLALASSVKRIGDNNWVSVSRAIKPYGECNRPLDWFLQKNCALQYSELLDKVETPKRKRGERDTETPGDVIARKLTIERIEELKRTVQKEQDRYKKLKEDVELLISGQADDRFDEMDAEMEREKTSVEEAEKKWAEEMVAREARLGKNRRPTTEIKMKTEVIESVQDSPLDTMSTSQEEGSNLSMASTSPAPSPVSQDLKPVVMETDTTPGDHDCLAAKQEPKDEFSGLAAGGDAGTVLGKTEADKLAVFSVQDVKEEPCEVAEEVEIKQEPTEPEDPITEAKSTDAEDDSGKCVSEKSPATQSGGPTEQSDDDVSVAGQSEPPAAGDQEINVPVVEQKDDKDVDSGSEGPGGKYDDPPLSPASSVMSNDTDSGLPSGYRGRGRRGRGGKSRRGRPSKRQYSRKIMEDDKLKESETSSKAESSDDGGDPSLLESDDTASNYTGRHQMSFTESVPNSPASIAPGDTEDEKAHKIWKKSIMLVWRAAANHKYANVFSHPVTQEIAPGYHSIVMRPMDLSNVKKNIESSQIRTTAEFQRDMMLMFTNATMYNNSDHDVHHMASEMYADVMRHIEQYVHTQIMVQGGEPKLLRTSRRSEVQSDKEEEPKRKRTTSDQDTGGKIKKRKA